MKKQKTSSLAITFYVFSVLFLLALIFNAYTTYVSVKEAMSAYGYTFASTWQAILSSYLSYCLLPLIGAVVTYGIGCIINKAQLIQDALNACVQDALHDQDEQVVELHETPQTPQEATESKETADLEQTEETETAK